MPVGHAPPGPVGGRLARLHQEDAALRPRPVVPVTPALRLLLHIEHSNPGALGELPGQLVVVGLGPSVAGLPGLEELAFPVMDTTVTETLL